MVISPVLAHASRRARDHKQRAATTELAKSSYFAQPAAVCRQLSAISVPVSASQRQHLSVSIITANTSATQLVAGL